jgi:hypothetical protein
MLHADVALARRIDRAEIDFCASGARAGEPGGAAVLEIAGGLALCGAPGMPFNKLLGLGLDREALDADLDRLEEFYVSRGVVAQVELCPLAPADLAPRLLARGFMLQGFENELARVVPAEKVPAPAGVTVTTVGAEQDDRWLQIVTDGFARGDGKADAAPHAALAPGDIALAPVTEIMRAFEHPGESRAIAWIDGTPVSAGACGVMDRVLFIYGTATLPALRRRGGLSALVGHFVNSAIGRADLAIATVQPGSVSQRTFERLGFQVVYTRAVFVKG